MESSIVQFAVALLTLTVGWLAWSIRDIGFTAWVKHKEAKGVFKGIVMAIVITLALAIFGSLTGCANGKWANDATVYAGLDYTEKVSPNCVAGGVDDHTTSNLGVKVNIFESEDALFRNNIKYTHHSCAFSEDAKGYDAYGIELEYKLWER